MEWHQSRRAGTNIVLGYRELEPLPQFPLIMELSYEDDARRPERTGRTILHESLTHEPLTTASLSWINLHWNRNHLGLNFAVFNAATKNKFSEKRQKYQSICFPTRAVVSALRCKHFRALTQVHRRPRVSQAQMSYRLTLTHPRYVSQPKTCSSAEQTTLHLISC